MATAARLISLGAIALASVACMVSTTPVPTGDRPTLRIANGTTLDVTLFVNGVRVAESRAGAAAPEIDVSALPPLPWSVEARAASGRVLTTMQVEPGHVWSTTRPDGGLSNSGVFGRVDLSCGRLTIWAGAAVPGGPPPAPSSGVPGDCEP